MIIIKVAMKGLNQEKKGDFREIEAIFKPGGALSSALPEYEPRAGQVRMANGVWGVMQSGGKLVVEAGTGTGKTCAYLVPAVLSGHKVVISTGTKNLEEQIFHKDIPLLKKHLGMKFNAALMKGRRNYLCLRRWKRFIKNPMFDFAWEGRLLDRISRWVERTKTGDRSEIKGLPENYSAWKQISSGSENCLGSKCPENSSCYVNKMRRDAQSADIVVVNHALFFSDMGLKGKTDGASILPHYDSLIFDEAHLLEDAATSHFGFEVSTPRIDDLLHDITRGLTQDKIKDFSNIERAALGIQAITRSFFDSLGGQTAGQRVRKKFFESPAGEHGAKLAESFKHLSGLVGGLKGEEDWERLSARAIELADDLMFLISQPSHEYVYWRERRERFSALRASPIDLKSIFQGSLYPNADAIVFTSATLSIANKLSHFRNSMGLDENTKDDMVGTPFDLAKQAVLFVPKGVPDPSLPKHTESVAEIMKRLVEISRGRAFLLFTSYRALEEVFNRISPAMKWNVLKQGSAPRSEILENFRASPSVLFATHSFWQGVDVMGDALSLVVIDKLPFAVPSDPVVEARIEWIRNNGGEPFNEYQLPHAILMLKQGLGRLLRHRNDKGILAVLDPRIHTKGYGAIIKASLGDFAITDSIAEVENFARRKMQKAYGQPEHGREYPKLMQ